MSMFDNPVKVTGKYAFSFTTFIWDHPWDGRDYAYCHDVNEVEGLKAFRALETELGARGMSMKELFQLNGASILWMKPVEMMCIGFAERIIFNLKK